MIICLCEGISDREIRAAARSGKQSVAEITRQCGAGSGCGQCLESLRSIVKSVAGRANERQVDSSDHCHAHRSALD